MMKQRCAEMITLSIDDQPEITMLMRRMLTSIDPGGIHMTASDINEARDLLTDDVQIIFLDIEMPGLNGIDFAKELQKRYKKLNVIFVTGHPEYAVEAFQTYPSDFIVKPVIEKDILRAVEHLRIPLEKPKMLLKVICSPFGVFVKDKSFDFRRDRTMELFAYLVYKNGMFCSNNEIISILWGDSSDKQGHLRQLILDMRECLREIGGEFIIIKKYGKIGIDMSSIECVGTLSSIALDFRWI